MHSDEMYKRGYSDGYHDVIPDAVLEAFDDNYLMGYKDGIGDREQGVEVKDVQRPFIDEEFVKNNPAPEGYEYTGEHRTPAKGEIYLTKNGNAGIAKDHPRNNRLRHILIPHRPCNHQRWDFSIVSKDYCKFKFGHTGKHSWELEN